MISFKNDFLPSVVFLLYSEEMEQRQTKVQREVVEARHGVNFILVSSLPHSAVFPFRYSRSGTTERGTECSDATWSSWE